LYVSRILTGIVFMLVLCLAGGTIYALLFNRDNAEPRAPAGTPPEGLPAEDAAPDTASSKAAPLGAAPQKTADGGQESAWNETFTGIGRLRAATAAPESAAVILTITFPYNARDKAFAEELNLRIPNFRAVTLEYFRSFSREELRRMNENAIKTEMLRRFNAVLRLGRIETLYFKDYMIVE
jgi:flagellar basal body-associated protein FliL